MSNLGWLFYKDYFNGIIYDDFPRADEKTREFESRMTNKYQNELNKLGRPPWDKDAKKEWEEKKHCILYKNECLIKNKITNIINQSIAIEHDEIMGNTHLKATTTYPGLIMGSGNAHALPGIEGQAILGFYFDYTTGLPVIPGPSIKGVLRSAFKCQEYIKELLSELHLDDTIDIGKLELEIFGQRNESGSTIQGKDIFFDATITSDGKILDDDYIAPHGSDPLKNPTPLRFIKVVPNVNFRFDFELQDGILNKSEKAKLFQNILENLGLGAKTNVGYGKFENFASVATEEEREEEARKALIRECTDIVKSNDRDELKKFIARNLNCENRNEIEKRLEYLDNLFEIERVKGAFDALDKINKQHIENFIKKYKDDTKYADIVIQAKDSLQQLSQTDSITFESILEERSLSSVLAKLKKYTENELSEDEKKVLLGHIESDDCRLNYKKKKYPHTDMKKYLGDKEGQALFDRLF